VVPFSGQVEVLAGGLASLVTEGETALWDSLIFALHNFNGLKGKRALMVLSDGEDSNSEYSYDDALEYARRSGVALYTIGIGISPRAMDVRSRLSRLGTETGGGSYFIDGTGELKRVYAKIEAELRAQFLIVYQSDNQATDGRYREVEVKVKRPSLRASTQRGYYP
jgi:Ca-activated chloride channel family protein